MFNLSPMEIVVIVVAAILIFGQRLPQVAAEFGGWVVKLKRSLNELRRESGIDREIQEVRRQVENAVPREVRGFDPRRAVEREVAQPLVEGIASARDEALRDRREDAAAGTPAPVERSPEATQDPAAGSPAPRPAPGAPVTPPPEDPTAPGARPAG